jgi:hypothetical protein
MFIFNLNKIEKVFKNCVDGSRRSEITELQKDREYTVV